MIEVSYGTTERVEACIDDPWKKRKDRSDGPCVPAEYFRRTDAPRAQCPETSILEKKFVGLVGSGTGYYIFSLNGLAYKSKAAVELEDGSWESTYDVPLSAIPQGALDFHGLTIAPNLQNN